MNFDLLIQNGTLVLPWGLAQADIGVSQGCIAAIGKNLGVAKEVFDATNLHILPGIIDPHVHFRDGGKGGIPGVEDLLSGTKGAVLGGVTSVFDMPNTNPAAVDAETLNAKRDYINGHAYCDVGIYVGATTDNADTIGTLETIEAVCAIKVFAGSSTGNLLVASDADIERVMRSGRRRIAFHSEDEYRLQERRKAFSSGDGYENHAIWRDIECAFLGTRRISALARKTNRPAHILHVSTAEELDYLKGFHDIISVEVLLNHLVQSAPDVYERLGAYGVMNPPIRDARHVAAAWAAIADGTIDTIGSDHAPHARANKEKPWPDCAAGLTGVQTLLPMMLEQVHQGKLSLLRLADLMSAGPARIYGAVNKGRIAAGYDADVSIVDLNHIETISNEQMGSQCGWTPFDGITVTGWPVATIVRGNIVMREGEVFGPIGKPIHFNS
ncbi:MAG: dihydroorotase [Acidocella sp. 20-57-95]|nr:MAG: dihydroorotase [Acidocella sp. 20-57-95]OYV58773.1 MAG: dihydroorotase [Acidocella sp. 21-58-7]HQT65026.1 dihydroorotase [Acidocella sp.]HQU03929.1 dihydroorotase [Acidocella sp.]